MRIAPDTGYTACVTFLAAILLKNLPGAPADESCAPSALASLEAQLNALHARGAAAWSGLDLSPEALVRHLTRHLPPDARGGALVLPTLHAEDFFLAAACVEQVPEAVEAFQRDFLSQVPLFVARVMRGV